MGKVVYSTGIEYVRGSLAKPKKLDGHNHGDYLIGTHRVAPTTNPNCTRLYVRKGITYDRVTPETAKETAARLRFATVSAAIKARKADMMQVVQDQETFLAQKNLPGGKKTMNSWYWYVEGQAYDKTHANG